MLLVKKICIYGCIRCTFTLYNFCRIAVDFKRSIASKKSKNKAFLDIFTNKKTYLDFSTARTHCLSILHADESNDGQDAKRNKNARQNPANHHCDFRVKKSIIFALRRGSRGCGRGCVFNLCHFHFGMHNGVKFEIYALPGSLFVAWCKRSNVRYTRTEVANV